jgi:Mg2+/Co2+ transporter CorB
MIKRYNCSKDLSEEQTEVKRVKSKEVSHFWDWKLKGIVITAIMIVGGVLYYKLRGNNEGVVVRLGMGLEEASVMAVGGMEILWEYFFRLESIRIMFGNKLERFVKRRLRETAFNLRKVAVFKDFGEEVLGRIGSEKILVLMSRENGISEGVCRAVAENPCLVDKIEVDNLENRLARVEFDTRKVGVFKDSWEDVVGAIGIGKILVLVKNGNRISEGVCRTVAEDPFLVKRIEVERLENRLA